jgi:NAD(P)H-dependent FMN reductase
MKLAVIIGTVRQERKTPREATWVANSAKEHEGVEVEVLDLIDYPMPFFEEAVSPRYNPNRQPDPVAKKWLDKLEEFDAYIFITPEYNHSIPGVLKNAIDYIDWQIQRKPTAVVSHGAAGGARAADHLKEILSESRSILVPTLSPLAVVSMSSHIDEEGNLDEDVKSNPYGPQPALDALIREIKWYSDALKPARAQAKRGLETA